MDPKQTTGVKFAMVDGDPSKGPLAFGIESAAPFDAGLHHHTSDYHAVVLGGTAAHWVDGAAGKDQRLVPGSYWFQPGKQVHGDACLEGTCRLFLMMPGALDFIPK